MRNLHTRFIPALFFLYLLSLSGCNPTKKAAQKYPAPPAWISERPVEPGYYFGVGSAPKRGSAQIYRQRASEKALSDIAGQIRTKIKSNVSMYRVEDKFGVREVYENRINAESEDFLEGQEFVDEYQNEDYYYVLYRLSASLYQEKKNERKEKALDAARQNYLSGLKKSAEGDYQLSVRFFVKALENVYPFHGEETSIISDRDTLDLMSRSLEKLKSISELLKLKSSQQTIEISGKHFTGEKLTYSISDHLNRPVTAVPILFSLNGGYLISDRSRTDSSGNCKAPAMNILENRDIITLTAKIDFSGWVNQSTEIIGIRNIVKEWPASTCKVVLRR